MGTAPKTERNDKLYAVYKATGSYSMAARALKITPSRARIICQRMEEREDERMKATAAVQ